MTKKNEEVVAKEVVIKNVVVTIGERDIVLTIEEAKKLRIALEGIFGKEVIKEVIKETKIIHEHDWITRPYVFPKTYDWDSIPGWDKYEITCDASQSKVALKNGRVNDTLFLSIQG